jgi:mono/diheme cytochrome c family protein
MRNSLPALFLFGAMAACGADPASPTELPPTGNAADEALAVDLAIGLTKACPLAPPGDEGARQACGEGLAKFALLRDRMEEPFLWGAQGADKPLDLYENNLTRFNPLVWRKMYASLFMFGSDFRIEQSGTQTRLFVPYAFRGELDTGSYPYPFWHSKGKWDSYQFATELVLFLEDGKLLGAMRSAKQDPSRPFVPHSFDGKWEWATPEGLPAPATSMLYAKLFSPQNAMIPQLDHAFRALEQKARSQNCNSCHSPDNAAKASQLVLLNYPNQAIFARNSIVAELETNTMPLATGITNEADRPELLGLAREFQAVADQALRLEGERVR